MWFNPIMCWLVLSPFHFVVSGHTMLMTYTGRKSGKSYTVPMNYLRIGDALYTISSHERVWWRNLRGGASVSLRLRGKDLPAQGSSIEDHAEVASYLSLYLEAAPQLTRVLGVQVGPDGTPEPKDIQRLAKEKVVVRTQPCSSPERPF
jgi:deazaflavin-dependent oxidoreductase (nitroreductase family)